MTCIAGGTHQRLLFPICGDQNQCFRRAEFLDAPTSHSQPFRQGLVARKWLPYLFSIYLLLSERAKVRAALIREGAHKCGA